jgi:trimeric autotransporter adhesin
MRNTLILRLSVAFAATALALPAHAFVWTFSDPLEGSQEVPPVTTSATGTTYGTFDDSNNYLYIYADAVGFSSNVTAAHIHIGAAGVNGPIVYPLSGSTGGTTYSSFDFFILSASEAADFLAGLHYVNIHTINNPGGEVRGQVSPVPEPTTLAALGVAAGLAALRRRRAKIGL